MQFDNYCSFISLIQFPFQWRDGTLFAARANRDITNWSLAFQFFYSSMFPSSRNLYLIINSKFSFSTVTMARICNQHTFLATLLPDCRREGGKWLCRAFICFCDLNETISIEPLITAEFVQCVFLEPHPSYVQTHAHTRFTDSCVACGNFNHNYYHLIIIIKIK